MSEHVTEVSDSSFETTCCNRPAGAGRFLGRLVRALSHAGAHGRSGRRKVCGNARVVKLNVDDNPSVSQRYGIKGIPTLILFKGGKEEERVVGATSKEAISRMIDKHIGAATAANQSFKQSGAVSLLVQPRLFNVQIEL